MNLYSKITLIICFAFVAISSNAQQPGSAINAQATVVDKNNVPIPGVNILIQEKTSGTITDAAGNFKVECSSNDILILKKTGFNTLQKAATEFIGGTITMTPALIDAGDDDNVFIPFGIRKKREVSASISTIKGTDLPHLPISTLNNILSGRLAGLYIKQTGTRPGTDDATFLVRGRSSYNSNQEPIVLVDGVERDFVNMDINEIEGISVLKDAATLAWYGMRGANGVVYVTTKRGSPTTTRVTLDVQGGVQVPENITKPVDSYNYALLYNQALANDGLSPLYDQTALDGYKAGTDPFKYPNINFVDKFIKSSAPVQRYVATVSGGNAFVKYFSLLSYYNQDGLYKGAENPSYNANTNYKRYNFRTNLDLHLNKNLDVVLDVGGRVENLRYPTAGNGGFLNAIYNTPSNAFPLINADGTYGGSNLFRVNPQALLNDNGNLTDLYRTLLATLSVKQKLDFITKGLSVNAFYTYDINGLFQSGFSQAYEVYEFNNSGGSTRFGNKTPLTYTNTSFSGNNRNNEFWGGFDYDRTFGNHDIKASTRVQRYVSAQPNRLDNTGINYANRISYGYKQKYFVDVVASYAGSQNFAPSKRFGFFPAVSAGWIISEENFLQGSNKFLDYLKLRGSYGSVGNDGLNLRRYPYRSYFTRGGSQYVFGTGYNAVSNTTEVDLGNPDLTWEKAVKTSVGFDAKFFKQSLTLSADYFSENRKDLLTTALLPNILGQAVVSVNEGEAAYKGYEAALGYDKTFGKVNIKLNGNYTYAKSKIISINEEAGIPSYQKQAGFQIGGVGSNFTRRFLVAEGIFQTQAEIDAAPKQRFAPIVKPGDLKYKDINGDGVIDNLDFIMTDYSDVPTSYFGFGTQVSAFNFDLSLQFQGVGGRTIQINDLVNAGSNATGYINQFSAEAYTPATAGTAIYPKLTIANRGNNTANSTFWLRDGDYLRLKTAELGYTIPVNALKRLKIKTARIYVSGFNLLTFSKVNNLPIDPEIPTSGYGSNYPYVKTFSGGVSVNF